MIKDSSPVIMGIYNMDRYLRRPYNIYNDLRRSKLANDHLNVVEKDNSIVICKNYFFFFKYKFHSL